MKQGRNLFIKFQKFDISSNRITSYLNSISTFMINFIINYDVFGKENLLKTLC